MEKMGNGMQNKKYLNHNQFYILERLEMLCIIEIQGNIL